MALTDTLVHLARRHGTLLALGLVWIASAGTRVVAGEREAILGDRLRDGWSVSGTRALEAGVEGGLLVVRPTDQTRAFATATLAAGDASSIDARSCAFLTFEINTLGGATGQHRAPSLRIGVSDSSRRSRQPVLSRYLRFDSDPATWQQALLPLGQVLDRGIRSEAITCVSFQYAGPAAPFAVRRLALVDGALPGGAGPAGPGNLLADASFEAREDARPVWPLVGDYRDRSAPGERLLLRGFAAHGKRFLRLSGNRAYFFQAMAPRADAVGFAVAVRRPDRKAPAVEGTAPATPGDGAGREVRAPGPLLEVRVPPKSASDDGGPPAQVEIGCEVVGFGTGGGVSSGARAVRIVALEEGWRRQAVSAVVHLEDMPPAEGDLRLYRGWVRPLGADAVVDLDAAQLAPAPVKEEDFQEERANALATGEGVFRQVRALMGLRLLTDEVDRPDPPRLQAELPPVSIPLEIREWAGHAWTPGFAAGGIPVARGRIFSPDALHLRGPDGNDIPFQFDVLRRDQRDGSVRCLWLAVPVPLGAGERMRCTLESGATAAPQAVPVASQVGDDLLIHTGAFRARLSRLRFTLFDEAQWAGDVFTGEGGGIRLELLDGRILTSGEAPTQVSIERNGPLHAVAVVTGYLAAEDGRTAPRFRYEARLRAWRGVPGLQVDLAVTNLSPEPATPVRSLALVVPLGRSRQAEAGIGREEGGRLAATVERGQILRLTQQRDPFGPGREEILLEKPGAKPSVQAGRAGGWAEWKAESRPPVFLAFGDMADRHPSALEVRPEGMAAYLIAPTGTQAWDFPFGLTAYGQFWLGSGEPASIAVDRLQRPPLLAPLPAEAAGSGVFQSFMPAEETRQRFPLLNSVLERDMGLGLDDRERTGETGWLNDGDTGSFAGWAHGETDGLEGLYLHYLRTGDPLAWRRARRQALHLREVCTWWANEESASQHPRGAGSHFTYRADVGSLWTTGLLYDYWLTGDRRSLAVAEALSAEVLSRTGYAHYGGWERSLILLHLAELYGATGRRVYRESLLRYLAHAVPAEAETDTGGMAVSALAEALEAIQQPDLQARYERDLGALRASLQRSCPVAAIPGTGETFLFRALSRAGAGGTDGTFWQAALDRLLWLFLTPHGRDLSLPRATQALPAAAAAGASLPAWAVGTSLGIGGLTGQGRTLTLGLRRRGSEPASVAICRMRAAHPDPNRRYRVQADLRDPLGKLVETQVLEGPTFSARLVTLPRPGVTGDYLLKLTCDEDGLAEAVSAFPHFFLRADEWKAARHPNTRVRFFVRGPSRGEVRIAARGPVARGGDALFAAVLRSPDGAILDRARWSPPMPATDGEGRVPSREPRWEPLRLPVPAACRGKVLALEVTVPRSVEWRVEGLDDPWLAATEEAFR